MEAARYFAQRMIDEGGKAVADRIGFAYQTALARAPRAEELKELEASLSSYLSAFKKNPDRAKALIAIGEIPADDKYNAAELAAYTMVGNLIMNLDEFITKH